MKNPESRLAAVNHHPLYDPPAFMDETHLRDVEILRSEAEEDIERMRDEGSDVPAGVAEIVYREVPAMAQEIRHLRKRLGWSP